MTILSRNEGHDQHGVEVWIKVLTLYLYVYFVTILGCAMASSME